ncbi:recombinase family protein [Acidithiobacillus thiooxidans]|jgi:DNA invertase Pin-like site-specific DNA recombinase|uniref:recombinase family protein n=1 Tax=Acidithiobacillus TaxID=119977 RepID=UPI001C06E2C2|nr:MULTISPECIES: recombinase family protein [Acidithiobacillus]MBU2750404.1 recombinase family protein [Acidithiobacillus thiooxidans]MBU2861417.1 recombinase family protein [Acidithiobacillus ferrooxidans]
MPTAAIYARFSSDQQRETSIEDQVRRCKSIAERNGYTVPDQLIFSDSAISGSEKATTKREGYKKLLDAWDSGKFECLILDEISRISRSLKETIKINDRIVQTSVRLLTVDGRDSQAANWREWLEIGAIFAEKFLHSTAFRVRRGMAGQLQRGYEVNSPPYGYDAVPVGISGEPITIGEERVGTRWMINPEEAKIVVSMFQMRKNGKSFTQICHYLNASGIKPPRASKNPEGIAYWRPGTVRRLLSNEVFCGILVTTDSELTESNTPIKKKGKTIRYDRPHLRILDDALWIACNKTNGVRASYGGGKNPLSGLIECGACGTKLSLSSTGKNQTFVQSFYCASCAQRKGVGLTSAVSGSGHTAKAGVETMLRFCLQRIVDDPLIRKAFKDRLRAKLSGNGQSEVRGLQEECRQAEKKYTRAVALLSRINDDEQLSKTIIALYSSWKTLEARYLRKQAASGQVDQKTIARQLQFDPAKAVSGIFDAGLPPERLRAVLRGIFPRIISNGKTDRFTSHFQMSICPGALAAIGTGTEVQDKGFVTLHIRLTARTKGARGWLVEEIAEQENRTSGSTSG